MKLDNGDLFNIILFDNSIYSYSEGLLQASSTEKNKAVTYVKSISAGGSTNLNDGVELGLTQLKNINEETADSTPIIVLLTDGHANSGKFTSPATICPNIKSLNTLKASLYSLGL